jgi:indolepyruvate ferredoxin oxidoreductase beta subunit
MSKNQSCNIVIAGIGGQGLITLLKIITEAAMIEGYDLATSELHGLAQRGGSVEVHIRFGKEIYSPLVRQGGANLIISLEAQESLKSCYYASKEEKTIFLINDFFSPIQGSKKILTAKEVSNVLQPFSQKVIFLSANQICQKELGTTVTAGIFILGLAIHKGLIPLKEDSIIQAIKKIIPEKYLELNLKSIEIAKRHE